MDQIQKKKTSTFQFCSHLPVRAVAAEAITIMYGGFRKFVGAEMEGRAT